MSSWFGWGASNEEEEAQGTTQFIPWKSVALECLPEHITAVYEVLVAQKCLSSQETEELLARSKDKWQKARRVSKQKADEEIENSAIAWDNLFYVLAIGRGSPSGLRPDAVAGLLALLVGHKPTSKHLSEAALLSLTRIFAGSKDDIVTAKIAHVWETHENADVRDVAILSLAMVGNVDRLRYTMTLRDLLRAKTTAQVQTSALWSFCPDRKVRFGDRPFDWRYIKEVLSDKTKPSKDVLFTILRLAAATPDELRNSVTSTELFDTVKKDVLYYKLSRRLLLEAAILLVRTQSDLVEKLPSEDRQDLLNCISDLRKVSNFSEVRQGTAAILIQYGDPRAKCLEMVMEMKQLNLDKKKMKDLLTSSYPSVASVASEYDVEGVLRVSKQAREGITAPLPNSTTAGLAVLLFILIQSVEVPSEIVNKVPSELVNRLLASRRVVSRICGLIHVGVARRTSFRGQVLRLLVNDPLEEVRSWAADSLNQLSTGKEDVSPADRLVEVQQRVLTRERRNLVLDLEFITGVTADTEVDDFFQTLR